MPERRSFILSFVTLHPRSSEISRCSANPLTHERLVELVGNTGGHFSERSQSVRPHGKCLLCFKLTFHFPTDLLGTGVFLDFQPQFLGPVSDAIFQRSIGVLEISVNGLQILRHQIVGYGQTTYFILSSDRDPAIQIPGAELLRGIPQLEDGPAHFRRNPHAKHKRQDHSQEARHQDRRSDDGNRAFGFVGVLEEDCESRVGKRSRLCIAIDPAEGDTHGRRLIGIRVIEQIQQHVYVPVGQDQVRSV